MPYESAASRCHSTLLRMRLHLRRIGWRTRALWRTTPFSAQFGTEFGQPVDRYYIEAFLEQSAHCIRGRVLEVGDATYTRKFGASHVVTSDVLHAEAGNAAATIVGNLATGQGIPQATFDCMILTQVLPFIFDIHGVVATCAQALRPGGSLLLTVGGISQISRYDMDRWGDYWRFTSLGLRRLLEEHFPAESIEICVFGNVLSAAALLYGVPSADLSRAELLRHDADYEVLICARVTQPANPRGGDS